MLLPCLFQTLYGTGITKVIRPISNVLRCVKRPSQGYFSRQRHKTKQKTLKQYVKKWVHGWEDKSGKRYLPEPPAPPTSMLGSLFLGTQRQDQKNKSDRFPTTLNWGWGGGGRDADKVLNAFPDLSSHPWTRKNNDLLL